MTIRILVSAALDESGLDILRKHQDIEVVVTEPLNGDALVKALQGVDGVIVRSESKLTREILEQVPGLRVIGRAGTGVDNIDVDAATQHGVAVLNAPGGNAVTTAEHTVALMMALARHIPQANQKLREGVFDRKSFKGVELAGKTLGVLGLGRIGAIVAERARDLKMRVVACDPFATEARATQLGVELADFESVLRQADFLTVHTPLTDQTRGLIDERAFELCKPGVRIINCARGGLIDEAALLDALNSGRCAGAALDVFEHEPPGADHPLIMHPKVVCTPHLGASTQDAQEHVAEIICEGVADYLTTGAVFGAVNLPSVSAETYEMLKPWIGLARRFGRVLGATFRCPLEEIRIFFDGEIAGVDTQLLVRALLKGLLAREIDQINEINALALAKLRGIRVTEQDSLTPRDFKSSLSVKVRGGETTCKATATLYSNDDPRIVSFNGVRVEAQLSGPMLWITNVDTPGVIGKIGTLLGGAGVNISRFHLGRSKDSDSALAVVAVDELPADDVIKKLEALAEIQSVTTVDLDTE